MKTVLLVASDEAERAELDGSLSALPGVHVLTARHGEEAVEHLRTESFDVLITELVMPVMDGFELLEFALEQQPGLGMVVMEDRSWGRLGQALTAEGAFVFVDKPVTGERLAAVVGDLCAASSARANLDGLSLAGVLQLLATEGRSCRVTVRRQGREASVDLADGEVVDATCAGRGGLEALAEVLSWERPRLEVGEPMPVPERRIHEPLPVLLLEAAHFQDSGNGADPDQEDTFLRFLED